MALQTRQLQQALGCQIYSNPSLNQIIEAYESTVLRWNPVCLGAEPTIDIYLQSVDAAQPIHIWKSVITSDAQLKTELIPDWWNNTQTVSLQLVITPQDQPAWAGLGPGPVFYAHFNGTSPPTAPIQSASHADKQSGRMITYEFINKLVHRSHALSGGKLGVAILFPLLAVAAAIAAYVFVSRRRSGQASKRWSQYVDQRMSQIGSQTWEAGAPPSIRGVPASRVASIYRHSASLPPRASFIAPATPRMSIHSSPNPRISAYSLANPPLRPPTNYSRSSRVVSFAEPTSTQKSPSHKSSLSVSTTSRSKPELLLSPSQEDGPEPINGPFALPPSPAKSIFRPGHHHQASTARSTSNLRFEIEDDPVIMSAVSLMMSGEPKPDASSASSATSKKSGSQNSGLKIDTKMETSSLGAGNASGMRRLAVRTSILSPDEALRQYTLDRERGPDGPASGPGEMKVLHNNTDDGLAMEMAPPRAALQSVYTEASRYSSASAEVTDPVPPLPFGLGGQK